MGKGEFKVRDYKLPNGPVHGLVISIGGQEYRYIETHRVVTKGGEKSYICQWSAPCAKCGKVFDQMSIRSYFPELRNCKECRGNKRSTKKLVAG